MMRIEQLTLSADRGGRHRVQFSNGSVLRLYRQTVEDFGLYAGKEMTEEEWNALYTAAGEMSAKMRAVRIVAASSVSRKDLKHRLIQKGEDPAQAETAVKWMEQLDLVDDRKTAEQIVSRCISKGYGLSRTKQVLYEKRIPKELWEDALLEYPDQSGAIEEYLSEKLPHNPDQKALRKVIDALIRRGHSYPQIRRALDQLCMTTEEFPEE